MYILENKIKKYLSDPVDGLPVLYVEGSNEGFPTGRTFD